MARIFPSWNEINNFSNPLTEGERKLAEFLDKYLPPAWDIYVQPFLNGDRPDVVILNPQVGVMVYEVKDWNLRSYQWDSDNLFVRNSTGKYIVDNPIEQVRHYRNNILNLYIPSLGEKIDNNKKAFSLIKTGVYFHKATTQEVTEFLEKSKYKGSKYEPMIGHDALNKEKLLSIVPDANYQRSNFIEPKDSQIFETLRVWLAPPFHSKEQGTKIKLDSSQDQHSKPNPGHHRIKAVAGSGKTLILAYRAARLASEGKHVLVITFNITLWHYIRDQIARTPFDFQGKNIVFKHFHGFCSDEYKRLGMKWPISNKTDIDEIFKTIVPNRLLEAITDKSNYKASRQQLKFDAILIDEGQDYCWEWYCLLCKYLTLRNELLLVCDPRQNIYKRDLEWTNGQMKNVQFRGRWGELKENKSYRLPNLLVQVVNDFAVQFLDRDPEDIPIVSNQMELFNNPKLIWENVSPVNKGIELCEKAYKYFFEKGVQPSDIIFLVPDHKTGWNLVNIFESKGINVNHVFEDPEKSHYHKKSFWMGDSRLKMSTIHSFKGWELKTVILLTPEINHLMNTGKSLDYLVYTALSRSMKDLCVINCCNKYDLFGSTWERLS